MSAHLTGGKINLLLVQELARKDLLHLLEKCDGSKAIVWDQSLAGPVGLITDFNLLKEHDVVKLFHLRRGKLPPTKVKNIIFITRPKLALMDMIADNIHGEERGSSKNVKKEYHLFFVPRRSFICEKWLKNRGVFGNFTWIEEFACDLFPVDNDLLSMELDFSLKETLLDKDFATLQEAAKAIMKLQRLYGVIPRISGKGPAAHLVWEFIRNFSRESKLPVEQASQIDHLLLIDRSIDFLSPLATQLTYEGLIDEFFGINNSSVQLPAEKFATSDDTPRTLVSEKKSIVLNSADELFSEIRDKNFHAVGPTLSKKGRLIAAQMGEYHNEQSLQQLKKFVSKLPPLLAAKTCLATHTSIAELIKEKTESNSFLEALQIEQEFMNGIDTDKVHPYIEDYIAQKEPLIKVLRLICMQSVTNSGLKLKVLEQYKREIIHKYGFQHIRTLANLEAAGILKVQQGSRQYTVLRKTLHLTVEDGSEITPTDISYVHSVYAPLSVRLTQHLIRPQGWKSLQDVLGLLPGPTIEETAPIGLPQRRGSITSQSVQTDSPKVVLVFFLGGCTFAEISALRFLSQQEESSVEFVIATTKLINGNTFIGSLMEPLDMEDDLQK